VIQGRGATGHPIHIHVNHFQVVAAPDGKKCDETSKAYSVWGEVGDWRDTIPALSGTTQVRYVLDRYGGSIMLHCHFLYHEDMGMMDRIWAGPDVPSCTASGGGGSGQPTSYCTSGLPEAANQASYAPVIKECAGLFNEGDAESDICNLYGTAPMTLTNIVVLVVGVVFGCVLILVCYWKVCKPRYFAKTAQLESNRAEKGPE
jgi:hypothetical protein